MRALSPIRGVVYIRDRLCGPEDLNMSAPIRPTSDEPSADADRPCHRWPIQQWVFLVRRALGWRPPTRRCQKKRRDRATRAAILQEVSRFLEDAEGASRVVEQDLGILGRRGVRRVATCPSVGSPRHHPSQRGSDEVGCPPRQSPRRRTWRDGSARTRRHHCCRTIVLGAKDLMGGG